MKTITSMLCVAALIGLVLTVARADTIPYGKHHQVNSAQLQSKVDKKPDQLFPLAVQNSMQSIADALKAANTEKESSAEKQYAADYLQSQKHMAKWAGWMLLIAGIEAFITLVGVILVAFTLDAARTSAREAGKAASAAVETVGISRNSSRAQARAYVCPGTFNRELATGVDALAKNIMGPLTGLSASAVAKNELNVTYFAVQPVWINSGSTPTQKMRIRVDWGYDTDPHPIGSYRTDWQPFFIAAKTVETSEFIDMPGLNSIIQDGAAGTHGPVPILVIWGVAEYEDIFGDQHWLHWCYRIRVSRPNPGHGLKISMVQWGSYNAASDKAE